MEMYLLREDLWSIVDGYKARPTTPTHQSAWDCKDHRAQGDLILCMKDNLLVHVKSLKASKEIWGKLFAQYQDINITGRGVLTRKYFHH